MRSRTKRILKATAVTLTPTTIGLTEVVNNAHCGCGGTGFGVAFGKDGRLIIICIKCRSMYATNRGLTVATPRHKLRSVRVAG